MGCGKVGEVEVHRLDIRDMGEYSPTRWVLGYCGRVIDKQVSGFFVCKDQ